MPSLSSNSLAMRSSPQIGLLRAISRISRQSSIGTGGRPGRDFQRQNRRKPWRCQRTKVWGLITTSACFQSKSLDRSMRVTRNAVSGRRGFSLRSWYIANCLRRNRFSAASAPCGRMRSQMNLAKSHRREVIVRMQSMMANIMPYQVSKRDALEIPLLKGMGSNFCGGQAMNSWTTMVDFWITVGLFFLYSRA